MSKLFENDDSGSDIDLKTDTDYAKNYNTWRQKEELHRLQMKYGDEISDESSSSSDDDEGEELNDKFEKDFFKTLSCLKNKDPRIYDKNYDFFEKTEEDNTPNALSKKKKKEQPVYVKDYERKLILEKGGQLSDEEEENPQLKSSTYVEEQETLKENLKNALKGIDDEIGEGEWGGLFKTRQKTAEEKIKEEEDYKQWLAGQSEHLEDQNVESELKPLKDFWSNPKLEEGEKFLRDYILKKKFLDSEDKDYIPTYEEVIHDSDEGLSDDEEAVSKQEEFEHKYNFRFEEPDQEFIKRYPRTMENSLRQKDDKRKIKRSERKERKKVEKQQKMEEIKQLKELKKTEIEEKIKKLQEITGNTEVGFEMKDLEDDFDPEEHDKRMQSLFSDEFYEGPEGEQKPEFPEIDEELELENWDRWHGNEGGEDGNNANKEYEPHCEDENFNMDCDYDPANTQQELIDNSKNKKKRRRKSKFAKVVSQPKPIFDPNNKTYQEYLDEYYKLDCEDIIGDVPCRFKYREVVPNGFGLSVEELEEDATNWLYFKSMGKRIMLKDDVVPHKYLSGKEEKTRSPQISRSAKKLKLENQDRVPSSDESARKKLFFEDTVIEATPSTSVQVSRLSESDIATVDQSFCSTSKDVVSSPSGGFRVVLASEAVTRTRNVGIMTKMKNFRSVSTITAKTNYISRSTSPLALPEVLRINQPSESVLTKPSISTSSSFAFSSPSKLEVSSEEYVPSTSGTSSPSFSQSLTLKSQARIKSTLSLYEMRSRFYLGIPKEVYGLLECLETTACVPYRDVLITLKKIRQDDAYARLADDFDMSISNVQRIFTTCVPKLANTLQELVYWPKSLKIRRCLPLAFRARYKAVESIIDCFEIEIEKPADPMKQSLTWSSYKNCNTIKYLVSATPNGFVNFISGGYGGRITDKVIVEESGFIDALPAGSSVLADRGFKHVAALLATKNCKMIRPPSVSEGQKLTKVEVKRNRNIASIRIHIERVIRRLREFVMLGPHACINTNFLYLMDYIAIIACALINLQGPLIK